MDRLIWQIFPEGCGGALAFWAVVGNGPYRGWTGALVVEAGGGHKMLLAAKNHPDFGVKTSEIFGCLRK